MIRKDIKWQRLQPNYHDPIFERKSEMVVEHDVV